MKKTTTNSLSALTINPHASPARLRTRWRNQLATLLATPVCFVVAGAAFGSAVLDPEPEDSTSHFGQAFTVIGDVNSDGVLDLAVGAPHHVVDEIDERAFSVGRAFVMSGNSDTVFLTLDDPTPEENGRLGTSVATLGDVNSDDKADFLVGIPGKDIGEGEDAVPDVGVAYLYSGADGSILRTLTDPVAENDARFGFAAANAGDVDGDGVADALIGAPGRAKAFVFSGKTGDLIFTIPSPVTEKIPSFFGYAVAGGRDLDGDGKPDFVIGAPLFKSAQGGALIFKGSDGTFKRNLRISSPQNFARAGAALAVIPDVTGDGQADIMVGVPEQDVNNLINAGEVLVFNGGTGRLFQTLTSATPQAFAGFGSVVGAVDFNSDGNISRIIGVPLETADLPDGGGDLVTHVEIGQIEIQ
jgi:hypothetical protein